jgi:hypothetical protein
MYDPTTGRWIEEDPIGLAGGETNLNRYVGNDPVNSTDPTGLVQYPNAESPANIRRFDRPLTTWQDWYNLATTGGWWNIPRQIRSPAQRGEVQHILDNLAGTYGLHIPWVDPTVGGAPRRFPEREAPAYQHIEGPNTLTPAQRARINIRVNLLSLKQDIVNRIYKMLLDNPPETYLFGQQHFVFGATGGPRLYSTSDYAEAANETANLLISVTDRFLSTHQARPRLGRRGSSVFGDLGDTRETHPWCADWAEAMSAWIGNWLQAHPTSMANTLLQFRWLQYRGSFQHNFIGIAPKNYAIRFSPADATSGVDSVLTIFDPWRDIMPRVYGAVAEPGGYPTDQFERNQLEQPYYR